MLNIDLSDESVTGLLKLQALYEWRNWNYIRIEDKVDMLRYRITDRVMTEIMLQIEQQQGRLLTHNK
jgi:hypothetical protein